MAAQVAPVPFDLEATFSKFEREVRLIVARTVPDFKLFVFPELYLTALGSFGDNYRPAGWSRSPSRSRVRRRIGSRRWRARPAVDRAG